MAGMLCIATRAAPRPALRALNKYLEKSLTEVSPTEPQLPLHALILPLCNPQLEIIHKRRSKYSQYAHKHSANCDIHVVSVLSSHLENNREPTTRLLDVYEGLAPKQLDLL